MLCCLENCTCWTFISSTSYLIIYICLYLHSALAPFLLQRKQRDLVSYFGLLCKFFSLRIIVLFYHIFFRKHLLSIYYFHVINNIFPLIVVCIIQSQWTIINSKITISLSYLCTVVLNLFYFFICIIPKESSFCPMYCFILIISQIHIYHINYHLIKTII